MSSSSRVPKWKHPSSMCFQCKYYIQYILDWGYCTNIDKPRESKHGLDKKYAYEKSCPFKSS